MGMYFYYSKSEHDWRLDISSTNPLSFLEIVGSRKMKGTLLNKRFGPFKH